MAVQYLERKGGGGKKGFSRICFFFYPPDRFIREKEEGGKLRGFIPCLGENGPRKKERFFLFPSSVFFMEAPSPYQLAAVEGSIQQ